VLPARSCCWEDALKLDRERICDLRLVLCCLRMRSKKASRDSPMYCANSSDSSADVPELASSPRSFSVSFIDIGEASSFELYSRSMAATASLAALRIDSSFSAILRAASVWKVGVVEPLSDEAEIELAVVAGDGAGEVVGGRAEVVGVAVDRGSRGVAAVRGDEEAEAVGAFPVLPFIVLWGVNVLDLLTSAYGFFSMSLVREESERTEDCSRLDCDGV